MNNRRTISAGEVNRYLYCNYQWYYHRKYGVQELRRRKKADMAARGKKPVIDGDRFLKRGLRFHARFERRGRVKKILRLAVVIAILGAVAYLILCGGAILP